MGGGEGARQGESRSRRGGEAEARSEVAQRRVEIGGYRGAEDLSQPWHALPAHNDHLVHYPHDEETDGNGAVSDRRACGSRSMLAMRMLSSRITGDNNDDPMDYGFVGRPHLRSPKASSLGALIVCAPSIPWGNREPALGAREMRVAAWRRGRRGADKASIFKSMARISRISETFTQKREQAAWRRARCTGGGETSAARGVRLAARRLGAGSSTGRRASCAARSRSSRAGEGARVDAGRMLSVLSANGMTWGLVERSSASSSSRSRSSSTTRRSRGSARR